MKKFFIISLILISSLSLFAELDIRIGVVDFDEIASNFLTDTTGYRKIEEAQTEQEETVREYRREISLLEESIAEAQDQGDDLRVKTLTLQKSEALNHLQTYNELKQSEIDRLKQELFDGTSQRSELSKKIYDAIRLVAINHGFSMVLDKNSPSVIWANEDVDITKEVIAVISRN